LDIGNFRIEATVSQSMGNHWDIYIEGQDDSIITVWSSEKLAKTICVALNKKIETRRIRIDGNSLRFIKKRE
jgi:hypothetical protein